MNSEEPAFPVAPDVVGCGLSPVGLTKREYFAAVALKGLLSTDSRLSEFCQVAANAVMAADALIAELSKGEK